LFSVVDNGVGIPQEKQAIIFDSFTQADSSTTRKFGGTGLGLAISKQLVTLMGGKLSVTSQEGVGSRFTFSVQVGLYAGAIEDGVLDAELALLTSSGAQVLLVEDNPVNQKLALHLLERKGYSVSVASDGQEAVDKVMEHGFDLILMDIEMPILGGLAATQLIRTLPNGGEVPIIALTAHSENSNQKTFKEAGLNGFVTKPINPEALYFEISQLLGKK
ncbi:MAG: response regulator, partial [Bdellovibrionales bacterium]|nr:response regulator [Bdellovibrionales bacterium]